MSTKPLLIVGADQPAFHCVCKRIHARRMAEANTLPAETPQANAPEPVIWSNPRLSRCLWFAVISIHLAGGLVWLANHFLS